MTEEAKTENLPEKKKPSPVVEGVLKRIKQFQTDREIDLPPDYSAPNALRSAYLILQKTKTKDKQPVLDVCTRASVANAMLDMVIQGLNPVKHQCSFIAYGDQLTLQREYQGSKAVAKRVDKDLDDIYAEVVYQGDELEYEIIRGRRVITKHIQKFENISNEKIIGAYAVAIDKAGNVKRSELMNLEQIFSAWRMSKNYPFDSNGNLKADSTHAKFKDEMVKKTVTSRLAKHIINSSSDSGLILRSVERTDDERAEAEAQEEIEEFGNTGDVIDITPAPEQIEGSKEEKSLSGGDLEPPPVEDKRRAAGGPGF